MKVVLIVIECAAELFQAEVSYERGVSTEQWARDLTASHAEDSQSFQVVARMKARPQRREQAGRPLEIETLGGSQRRELMRLLLDWELGWIDFVEKIAASSPFRLQKDGKSGEHGSRVRFTELRQYGNLRKPSTL